MMRIKSVEPIWVALPYEHGAPKPKRSGLGSWATQDILFVRVETDGGVVGWGEAFGNASSPVTYAAIRDIVAPLAAGAEVNEIAPCIAGMLRRCQSMARNGPVQFAISGLEIALWDIAGKIARAPVWKLLGGSGTKRRVPAYASLFRLEDENYVRRVAGAAAERGFAAVKLHEHTVEAVAAARAAIGPDVRLMVDTNCFWEDPADVVDFCRNVEAHDVWWVEEPIYPADRYDLMAMTRARTRVNIAAGENLGNVNDVHWLLAAKGVDILQPSVAKIGGIGETIKAMDLAQAAGIEAIPHSPFVGPALAATIHIIASRTEELVCENRFCDLDANILGAALVAKDGAFDLSDAPGLGLEVDDEALARYRVR
jgi:L-alanine-DL-glutamate epimerase-like enolase superfamily enzyme